ncbi:unnamed protein product [Callosobruchus maculatus]|uniref:Uncharacterized protein n=1 Tax=Callosobruchus maculatus TaxID=64391 RepID=A0A653CA69_CALMS|nr:unnamed protein product [Callosobruchus maculatus]
MHILPVWSPPTNGLELRQGRSVCLERFGVFVNAPPESLHAISSWRLLYDWWSLLEETSRLFGKQSVFLQTSRPRHQ